MISCYRHSWPGLGGYNFLLCFDGCRSDKRFSLLAWFSQAVRGICYYWKHVYNSDRFILFLIIENQFKQYTDLITSQSVDQIAGMLRQLMIKKMPYFRFSCFKIFNSLYMLSKYELFIKYWFSSGFRVMRSSIRGDVITWRLNLAPKSALIYIAKV